MELKLSKDEKKGMFGGPIYLLTVQLILSAEEKAGLKKIKQDWYALFDSRELGSSWESKSILVNAKEYDNPVTLECKTIQDFMALERGVKDGAQQLNNRIKVALGAISGEETISFD